MEGRGGSTKVVVKNSRGSTRASVALHQGDMHDEETTVVLLEHVTQDGLQRGQNSRRLANKFLQHYKGVFSNAGSV